MISPEKAQRVAEIVEAALEREPASIPSFLDESCGDDTSLRREVESLLAFQKEASDFIEAPAVESSARLLVTDGGELNPGDILGEYKILSLLGEGGMGEVYLAEDAQLRRRVAIKLVKAGLGRRHLLRHFQREERILAALTHPNIARLYGGAFTEQSVPYFVMEYVEGDRLDAYCELHRLDIPARLRLFRKICAAVAYAHQHLVIHRDLKPSNIRVTTEGEPKLLDFGIAKLLDDETTGVDQTITLTGVMTPDYASPEQVRGERMTTASDVYSLGVILYELLTGQRPYSIKSRRPDEIARVVNEQEPSRPSDVVRRAKENQNSPIGNPASLRGDLDNIVLMALRKEPERRYPSVTAFSEDIRRHLAGLPVSAHKDTVRYRASKFVRRNKVAVLAAALVAATLVAGIFATTWESRRANEQRRRAEQRFNDVRRLAHSLMFEIHDSVQDLQGSTPTRRLIVTRALEYLDDLAREAGGNVSLQRELATAYEKVGDIQGNPSSANLGDTEGALASYRKAAHIREGLERDTDVDTEMELGRTYRALGDIMEVKGDVPQTIAEYQRSLQLFQRLAAAHPDDAAVQDELARAYETLADGYSHAAKAEAVRLTNYQESLRLREKLLAPDPTNAKLQRSVALSLLKIGGVTDPHQPEASAAIRRGVVMLEAIAAAYPNDASARRAVGWGYYQLGNTLFAGDDFAGALDSRQKAFAIREQFSVNDPQNAQARFDLAVAHADLAESLTATSDPASALEHGRKALAIFQDLSAADPTNAIYSRNVALCEEKMGDALARVGADVNASHAERVHAWTESRGWFQKAGEIFVRLRDQGTLTPTDTDKPNKLASRAAECDRAIEQLEDASQLR